MHRFYVPAAQCQPPNLTLPESEAHHAKDVLRLSRGDRVTVLDGAGREFLCELRDVQRRHATLFVLDTILAPPLTAQITLIQAIPKGKLFESILQKAIELGAARVIPLLAERVITRLDADEARSKAEKWRQVAVEAIKQCGQPWLPQIDEPVTLPGLLERLDKPELALVGSLQGDGQHPSQYFHEFTAQQKRRPHSVVAWIGPEGDFTNGELDLIRAAGARPMTLGRLVLRCDTAALYTLAVINHELQAP